MKDILRTIYNRLPSRLKPAAKTIFTKVRPPIIDLASGDPDYQPPPQALEKATETLKKGLHYISPDGIPELRKKISEVIEREHGTSYDPQNEILVTYGASEALYVVFRVLLRGGGKAFIPSPHYPLFKDQIHEVGGKIITYPFKPNIAFNETLSYISEHLTEDVRFILINSPHNPTGRVLSKKYVETLAEFIEEKRLFVVWDEVYGKIVFEGKHYTLADIPEAKSRAIFVNSFSKTYGMAGWRVGFLYGPSKILSSIRKLHRAITFSLNPISQVAALAALEAGESYLKDILKVLRERRDVLIRGLSDIRSMEYWKPQGTYFVFPKLNLDKVSDVEFTEALLKEGVKVRPGSRFNGRNHIRISFARADVETIRKALLKIKHVMEKFSKTEQ
ncbi:MAG: hypothetical protein DRO23_05890 [Thermoprotei archaeon]|nr:MAG: hypothetical protein DRO23_05890 [Thermoprotei archaeon]